MSAPVYGIAEPIAPGVRRLVAPNPGPMTHEGTNTYLVGTDVVAVVDPGPNDPHHLEALLQATDGNVSHILITHAHRDHTGLVPELRYATGAPVMAFGPAEAGRSVVMERLAAEGLSGGGEGVDTQFTPDERLQDGDEINGGDWTVNVIHTPGHFAGHLCFRLGDILFSGDHIMEWSTTLISPPDGDVAAFMSSTRRLQNIGLKLLLPGHGPAVLEPETRMADLLAHREDRERQIVEALGPDGAALPEITRRVYTDIDPSLLPAASRNVLAHLIDLTIRDQVSASPGLSMTARFTRT